MASTSPSPQVLRALTASGAVFAVVALFVILDVAAGIQLPPSVRPALPWLMVGAALVSVTLLAGALGTPKRPGADADDPGDSPGDAIE